jgi:diguanylate cyclase (GGDEF)-like protein
MKKVEFDSLNERLSPVHRYALAVLLAATAVGLRAILLPYTAGAKFTTFYPLVILAFYLAGNGPGIAAIAVTAISAFYLFLPPYNSFVITAESVVQILLYLIAAGTCGYVVSRMRRYRKALLKVSERKLDEASQSLSLATDGAGLGVWSFNPLEDAVLLSDTCAHHYGLPLGVNSISYGKLLSLVVPSFLNVADRTLKEALADKTDFVFEHPIIWPDGSEHWIFVHGRPSISVDGSIKRVDGITMDITDRKTAEENYRASTEIIRAAFEAVNEGIIIVDATGKIIKMNEAVAPLCRFESIEQVPDTQDKFSDIFEMTTLDGQPITEDLHPGASALKGERKKQEVKFRRRENGQTWYGLISGIPIFRDDKVIGAVITGEDTTDRVELLLSLEKKVEQRTAELVTSNQALSEMSRHDTLTGLNNRLACNERLRDEFNRMKRTGESYCVLMLDIDRFKNVNDTFGHAIGDEILKLVSGTLLGNVRAYDFVSRWGGEEFLVLLPATSCPEACNVAEKLRAKVAAASHPIAGSVTISIGVAMASPDERDEDIAVKRADEALFDAKKGGRNLVSTRILSETTAG